MHLSTLEGLDVAAQQRPRCFISVCFFCRQKYTECIRMYIQHDKIDINVVFLVPGSVICILWKLLHQDRTVCIAVHSHV